MDGIIEWQFKTGSAKSRYKSLHLYMRSIPFFFALICPCCLLRRGQNFVAHETINLVNCIAVAMETGRKGKKKEQRREKEKDKEGKNKTKTNDMLLFFFLLNDAETNLGLGLGSCRRFYLSWRGRSRRISLTCRAITGQLGRIAILLWSFIFCPPRKKILFLLCIPRRPMILLAEHLLQ